VDTGAASGIAITGMTGNGTWQYSSDGATWVAFGAVSGSDALLLTSTAQVRYVPDGRNGETASFAFHAWDQTSGASGSKADASITGGSPAFSSQASTACITVTSVNDAPTITGGATVTLTATNEDTTSAGAIVGSVLASASWGDIDTGASGGIAITEV